MNLSYGWGTRNAGAVFDNLFRDLRNRRVKFGGIHRTHRRRHGVSRDGRVRKEEGSKQQERANATKRRKTHVLTALSSLLAPTFSKL